MHLLLYDNLSVHVIILISKFVALDLWPFKNIIISFIKIISVIYKEHHYVLRTILNA